MTRLAIHSHHSRSRSRQSVTVTRSHQGGHIRTLRRGSYRRAVSGNIYGIQELFARVETVGIQPRDRHAGEMQRKVFIKRRFRRRFFRAHRAVFEERT